MSRAFKRLQRVLELEAKQGYENKAVVGGIRQFAAFWVEQARNEAVDEADQAFVEQTAEVLTEYGRLPGKEARAKAIQSLMARLQQRQARLPQPAQTKPAARPSRPPKRPAAKEKQKAKPRPVETKKRGKTAVKERPPAHAKRLPGEKENPFPTPITTAQPDPAAMAQPVTIIKGVGEKIAGQLQKVGAETIGDLLYTFPRRYDDYTLMKPIKELVFGEQVTIIGTVWETRARRTRSNQVVVQSVINDGAATIQATWFNQRWLAEKLQAGMQIVISGKVDQYLGRLVFNNPTWEPLELEPLRTRRIVPVYPLTQGLTSNRMRDVMRQAVGKWAVNVPDPLPESVRQKQNLLPLPHAIQQIHFPTDQERLHKARRRLIFDELFLLQLGMQGQRREWQAAPGAPLAHTPETLAAFRAMLPYQLTGAQERVIGEITADMARDIPMNRLLQGDVGSGKTVVAAAAMFVAVKAGAQAALMAPTEILAEQHFAGLRELLGQLDVSVALLTGSAPTAEKGAVYAGLADGRIQVIIGTHALIQEAVQFHNLGLAVIDEQHRFGVDQRAALRQKGAASGADDGHPHLLVMSATPIPRSLALSLYGDLDLSTLDEMPPGRQEIKTRWLRPSERERAYTFIRRQAQAGRQAYIIYPLVEASDKIDAGAAVAEYERLQHGVFPELKLGLVHGRLKANEKEAAMRAFKNGETDVLVSTSVIEVGVDVPNSAVMLIENANRFGLAQLHQFRGRVGRGEHQSYCILIAENESADAEERLRALEDTNDGFALAEKDLEIRGPGEFFGRRQSGLPELRLASILDMEMLKMARAAAEELFTVDPELSQPEHDLLRQRISAFWEQAGDAS